MDNEVFKGTEALPYRPTGQDLNRRSACVHVGCVKNPITIAQNFSDDVFSAEPKAARAWNDSPLGWIGMLRAYPRVLACCSFAGRAWHSARHGKRA